MALPLSLCSFLFLLTLWCLKSIFIASLLHFISWQLARFVSLQPCYEVSHTLSHHQLLGLWIFLSTVRDLIFSSKMCFPLEASPEHSRQLKRESWEAGLATSPNPKGMLLGPMVGRDGEGGFLPQIGTVCVHHVFPLGSCLVDFFFFRASSGLKMRKWYLPTQEQINFRNHWSNWL